VDIASISILLSIQKQAAFLLHDARINTRDLHYRNQTWSVSPHSTGTVAQMLTEAPFQFEELVEQFIPSDPTWKGWVKMALHQPFFEVIPVARELISKTKRIASKGVQQSTNTITPRRLKMVKAPERHTTKPQDGSDHKNILAGPYADEPEVMSPQQADETDGSENNPTHSGPPGRDRAKVTSLFRRNTLSHSREMSGA
jgi:hypothetical protein